MALTFRARLTIAHALAVAAILTAAMLATDWWLSRAVESQVDAALVALAETEAASALDGREGDEAVHLHDLRAESGGPALRRLDKLVQIVDAAGRPVARGITLGGEQLPAPPALLARLARGEIVLDTLPDFSGEPVRLVSLPIEAEGRFRYALQVGTSLRPARAFLRTARLVLLAASAAILAAIILTGSALTARALRPIDRIVARARQIGESTLGERLPGAGVDDEIGRLAATLNEMLDRLEHSFDAQRRFTADASHELRSPLSRLRAELEVALRRPRTAAEYEAALRSSLEEVERLARMTEDLLTLARLDAGDGRDRAEADVASVVQESVARLDPQARDRTLTLVQDVAESLRVRVGPGLLALVVTNLLENAVKFSGAGGEIAVTARREDGHAVLAVTDAGPGLAPEELPRVFERFYRGRAAGAPDAAGVGLGLAIVRAVVESHGGRITVDSAPGLGATFTVRLPLAA
jgi:two-component system OmpR family sensor kinase